MVMGRRAIGVADIGVVIFVLIAGLGRFFLGRRRVFAALLAGGVRRVEATVWGGYSPDVIRSGRGFRWSWCSIGSRAGNARRGLSSRTCGSRRCAS